MLAKSNAHIFPVLALLFSATMWGVLWYPLRLLEQSGLTGLWATLLMYGFASLVLLPMAWRGREAIFQRPQLLLLLAVANGWCNVTFILAVLEGSVVRVLLLFYLSPIWVTLLGRMFLGERIDRLGLITLLLALAGAVVMLWEPELGAPWPRDHADWLAISSGMAFAVANVLVRKLDDLALPVKTWVSLFGVAVLATLGIVVVGVELPQVTLPAYGGALLLGFTVVLMTLAVQYGVTHMPVHRSAVILLFEVVAGAISSQLLSDEVIAPVEWVGGGLIILAAYLSTRSHLHER